MNEEIVTKMVETVLQALPMTAKMTLDLAKELIDKVEKKAEEMGLAVVIAVSDPSGLPVAVHSMDGAYIGSFDIALNKTFTAVSFKMSTGELSRLCLPGQSLYGIQYTNHGKVVVIGGGELLLYQGNIIGAIGVSGATCEEDTLLGEYGKSAFKEMLECQFMKI